MRDRWILFGLCVLLTLLWLPGLGWPITSDTSIYALLGRSIWLDHTYQLFGEPYAKHLPLQAIVSFPFTQLAGFQWGMKLSSLAAGWGVIIASYLLARAIFDRATALLTAALVTVHHGLVLMTMLGSADLLFTALFTLCLLALLRAGDDDRWYLPAGLLAGLASLARYNGVPLFALIGLWTLLRHPVHLKSLRFWEGMLAGGGIFALWLCRNAAVFGDPFHTAYTSELATISPGPVPQLLSNVVYYLQPQHNILPIALLLELYGLVRAGSRRWFLLAGMLTAWMLTAIWWVQAIRFAFPGFVLLLILASFAITDLWRRFPRWRTAGSVALACGVIATHAAALCLYAFPACNAAFDRTLGWLSPDLGLSSEGFHSWDIARDWLNAHAPFGAVVEVSAPENVATWASGVFREDLRVTASGEEFCPRYRIAQRVPEGAEILFTTEEAPVTYVVREQECEGSKVR